MVTVVIILMLNWIVLDVLLVSCLVESQRVVKVSPSHEQPFSPLSLQAQSFPVATVPFPLLRF